MPKLCPSADIPEGRCKEFLVELGPIFVVRKDNNVHAYLNSCPHLHVPLNWQENDFLDSDDELIQCSTHGAVFTIEDGKCVSGPCVGQFLKKITLREKAGYVFLQD